MHGWVCRNVTAGPNKRISYFIYKYYNLNSMLIHAQCIWFLQQDSTTHYIHTVDYLFSWFFSTVMEYLFMFELFLLMSLQNCASVLFFSLIIVHTVLYITTDYGPIRTSDHLGSYCHVSCVCLVNFSHDAIHQKNSGAQSGREREGASRPADLATLKTELASMNYLYVPAISTHTNLIDYEFQKELLMLLKIFFSSV